MRKSWLAISRLFFFMFKDDILHFFEQKDILTLKK